MPCNSSWATRASRLYYNYEVIIDLSSKMSLAQWFILKQFGKNADPAIIAELVQDLQHGQGKLTDHEMAFMLEESDVYPPEEAVAAAPVRSGKSNTYEAVPNGGGRYHSGGEGGAGGGHGHEDVFSDASDDVLQAKKRANTSAV